MKISCNQNRSLRGGGIVCSHQQLPKKLLTESGVDDDLIQHLIHDIECKCQSILDASKRIGLNESKENIMMNVGWFHRSSQFIHQIRQNSKMVQENIKIILSNLEVLLESILNLIQSQKFFAWLILKICNAFSLLIFIYYINNPNPPMKLQDQEKLQQYLADIQQYMNQAGQSYENSIQYEFELLTMCIETCPTNSQEGQEILINTFSGIISSIAQMSPSSDLISALGQGAIYLYKQNTKRRQKDTFQIIFYLEELKWQIIESIQNGKGLHNMVMILGDNYRKLVQKSNNWLIKCSWIKIISELIAHKPLITYGKFNQLTHQYQLDKTWNQVIQQKIVKPIDENKLIGIIQQGDTNDQASRLLQQQYMIFEQLKNVCLNGNQDISKFENLVYFNEKEGQDKNNQNEVDQIIKIQQYIDDIQVNELHEMSGQLLIKYQDYIDGFVNLKDYVNYEQSQFLTQIDQLTMNSNGIYQMLYDFYLQANIINLQLTTVAEINSENLAKRDQSIIDKYILVEMLKNYYTIIQGYRGNLSDFLEENDQFCKHFPENKLKTYLLSQEFQTYLKTIFDQQKNTDWNKLILKLEDTLKTLKQELKITPLMQISRYSQIQNQLLQILFTDLRQDFISDYQQLQYYAQLISYDKVLLQQNMDQIQTKRQYIYFSIISIIKNLYEQISQLVLDFKFEQKQAETFKLPHLQQVLDIYCNFIQLETNQLINYKICESVQKQGNVNFIINLLAYNKILNKFRNLILDSSSQLLKVKTMISKLKFVTIKQTNQPSMLDQLISNKDQLNKYLNSEDSQKKQGLTDIFSDRIRLLKLINNLDIDHNLIVNGIKINQILELEGFQQLQQVQYQIIQQSKDNFDIIINSLNIQQNQLINQDEVCEQIEKILTNIDQLIIKLNDQQIISQKLDQNQYQAHSNNLILKITYLIQNEKEQNEELQKEIEAEYKNVVEEFNQIIIFNKSNIEEITQQNFNVIKSLPSLSIPEDYFQNQELTHSISHNFEQKVQQTGVLLSIQDSLNDEQWRVKEYFYFNCLIILQSVSNQKIKTRIGQILLYGKFKETDFRVIQTLKNQEYKQQMEQLVNNLWQESKEDIKVQLQDSLNKLQNIQLQLQGEERKAEREKLQKQHRELEDQIEQQLKNVNEIGDILGVTISFLKDIQKDLAIIQKKLDIILNQIETIGQDIKFLRGKSPQQLLEIRMEQVIQNKIMQDSQSVYVQIFTKEYDFKNKKEKDERTPLFNHENFENGEVDEFLNEPEKSSLLIHGIAGAGKSLSARKIEEHLWLQYQKTISNKLWDQIKDAIVIPIFIQLPALKEPKFNAIEETLESSIYQFDQKQVNQFKEIVQSNNNIKLIFIMDSYDELSKQYQQINLIQTNKVNQWKHPNEKINPKVITTSRSEIFTNTYRSWFYGDKNQSEKSLKEIRLLSFDEDQRLLFLQQYSQLQLKLKIKELLEVISKNQHQDYILLNTLSIFDKVHHLINQEEQFIISSQSSQQIIEVIQKHPNTLQIHKEQQKSFNKLLQVLWSAQQYGAIIRQLNLKDILETPFFMNIVVTVLPQMNEKLSSQNHIKVRFHEYYKNNKIKQIQNIISNYECHRLNYQQLYQQREIEELKQLNYEIFIYEANQVWDCLIESNFFKHFIAQRQCMEIINLIGKCIIDKKGIFTQTQKEADDQNYLVIYNSLITKSQTIYDFYQEFLTHYIDQQTQKLTYTSEISDQNRFLLDVNEYVMKLAVIMTKQNETVIEIKQQGILFRKNTNKDPYSEFFQDQDKYSNYRLMIRKCLPIKQKSNLFQFHHKSIQEYLFAKYIIESLKQLSIDTQLQKILQVRKKNLIYQNLEDIQNIDQDYLISLNQNYMNQDINLGSNQMQGQMRFIKAGLQNQPKLQETCYLLALLSSICNQFTQLSSNALFIYSNSLLYVQNKDFSRIVIENISLDGINFVNCNFSESQLKRVSINGINLIYSNLANINWIDCYSNDLPCYRGAQQKITTICFLKDEQYIISGHEKGLVSLWDKQQAKLLNSFTGDKDYDIVDILNLSQDDEIQYAILYKRFNIDRIHQHKLQFWKVQENNTSLLIKKVQIDTFYDSPRWSYNNQYLVYEQLDQICIYDVKNLKILHKEKMSYNHFQIGDNNLIYIIDQDICIWNFQQNIKQQIRVSKIQEVSLRKQSKYDQSYIPIYKFSKNFKLLAISISLHQDFSLVNIEQNTHIQLGLSNIHVFEFSQDQQYLGIGGDFLIVFDIKNQCITQKLYGFNERIKTITFNSKITEIITLSDDGLIQYWDLEQCLQNTQQISNNNQVQIKQIQYSINGKIFYVQADDQIYVYDSNTGLQIDSIEIKVDMFVSSPVKDEFYFQQNGIWFSYNYNFKITTKLDIKSQKNLIISPDGMLVWANDDNLVCEAILFWWIDFVDKVQILQIDKDNKILATSYPVLGSSPCFSKDCQTIYYFNGIQIMGIQCKKDPDTVLYQFEKQKIYLDIREYNARYLYFDNNVFYIICAELKYGSISYYYLRILDRHSQRDMKLQNDPLGARISKIEFIQNKYALITNQSAIKILDCETFQQIGEGLFGHVPYTKQLIVSPNGEQFISLGEDNKIKIWEVNRNLNENPQQNISYHLKSTIPQKSIQNVLIHDSLIQNAKIQSHLGYNILENQAYKFNNAYINKRF